MGLDPIPPTHPRRSPLTSICCRPSCVMPLLSSPARYGRPCTTHVRRRGAVCATATVTKDSHVFELGSVLRGRHM